MLSLAISESVEIQETMNATSTDFLEEINGGSDSDTAPHDEAPPEYYQPISAVDYDESDSGSSSDLDQMNTGASESRGLPNGYHVHEAEDGMSSMHLNGNGAAKSSSSSSDDEDEEEEEERRREESESAIMRAFREDEHRRNAPLSRENARRVMTAMRGVSFGGMAPDWADHVPEDRWIDQLRRIRQLQNDAASTNVQN